jgi:hypothetical protein
MRPDGDRSERTFANVRLTVQEAADALGVTVEAVRGRMHRGKYGREKDEDGRVFVLVPTDQLANAQPERSSERLGERSANGGERSPKGQANVRSNVGTEPAELVQRLADEVAFLRAELADRNEALRRREELHGEEIRRRDHIIAGLVERVPALETSSPPGPRGASQTAAEDLGRRGQQPRSDAGEDEGGTERPSSSWWRRFFGFE